MINLIDNNSLAFLSAFLVLGIGAVLSLIIPDEKKSVKLLSTALCLAGSVLAGIASISVLLGSAFPSIFLGQLPFVGKLYFELNGLSAFFALIISIVGATVAIYSYRYMDDYGKKGYSSGYYWFLLSVFLLSMLAVVSAKNAILFLIAWETMTLASYLLVTYAGKEEESKEAGFTYFLIAHLGAAALTVMFLALYGATGSFDFANFGKAALSPITADIIFLLAFLGFGSKTGVIPLHIWLPKAHPQAPSGISALMSGVMLKVAFYGFIMVAFGFLGASNIPLWWGALIIIAGAISALLGVLYALLQHDIKRMLAYHSIENIGIIFIGIGAALLFVHTGNKMLAALALFAALYHTLNHALFKSLLFMGAGAVIHAAHTRDIEKMGGLIKLMPYTAILFFIASYAISAVPPLNGFASEWMTFQALIAGSNIGGSLQLLFGIVAISLALTSALALAAFVKVFGIVFLGVPRSKNVAEAKEAPGSMIAAMSIIAIVCILTGLLPLVVANVAAPAMNSLGFSDLSLIFRHAQSLPMLEITAAIVFFALLVMVLQIVLKKVFHTRNEKRVTWDCGIYEVTPKMQYTASGFSMPLMRIFGWLTHPFGSAAKHGSDFFEDAIYRPIWNAYAAISQHSNFLQTGQLSAYIVYIMFTLVGILIYAIM